MKLTKIGFLIGILLISCLGAYADLEDYYIPYGKELLGISQTEKYKFFLDNKNYLYNLKNGIYIDKELFNTNILKYVEFFIINMPELEEKYNKPYYKYFIKFEHGQNFIFLEDNKEYNVDLKDIKTALSANGYFAEYGTIKIISLIQFDSKEQFFTTLLHEHFHVLQERGSRATSYNIFNTDVKKLPLAELRAKLKLIDDELEAHKKTADFIDKMLKTAKNKKNTILSYLDLSKHGLIQEKNNEIFKYSLYEHEENEIINEIIKRTNA